MGWDDKCMVVGANSVSKAHTKTITHLHTCFLPLALFLAALLAMTKLWARLYLPCRAVSSSPLERKTKQAHRSSLDVPVIQQRRVPATICLSKLQLPFRPSRKCSPSSLLVWLPKLGSWHPFCSPRYLEMKEGGARGTSYIRRRFLRFLD